nr:hypothetical protein [Tanacetum cinerariifolium]
QNIGDFSSATQTMSMTRMVKDHDGLTQINNKDFHTCMFSCFLSQEEPKRVHQALKDPSWIEAMHEELLQFKMQKEIFKWNFRDLRLWRWKATYMLWMWRNANGYLPQPQYENYLCNLCGNNSHDGYDCQQQFPFVYEQEPSYNQNYDEFHCIPFEEKPLILLQAWFKFFAIRHDQPENSNELIQELLEDLNELAEYKESLENSSKEIVVSNSNEEKEEPLQDSNIHQLIEECSTEVGEEQKQKMEDTILELVKICQEKEFLFIHDNVEDLIKSALNSKHLLINSNSQRLDKKEQEVKNVVEQPAERGNRSIQSLQNFKVVHKSSISFRNTSQISSIHAVAPILSTKEPEHSLSMGYEHLSITHETESDEVTESNAENLLPNQSECEVTSEYEIECDVPAKDDCSPAFTTFSNPLFKDNDDLDSSDDESLPDEDVPANEFKVYLNPLFDEDEINSDKLDPHCFIVESDFVESLLNRDTFIDSSSKFDFSGERAQVNPEIPKSDFDFEEEICLIETLLEEIDIVTDTDDVLPPSVENDNDLSNDPLLEEADLFLSDNSIPPGIENVADDSEGDIRFLEKLVINDSFLSHESSDSNFENNPSVPRPPPEPPDAETDTREEIPVVMNDKDENNDYFPFMFVIRIFLPDLISFKVFFYFLSAESEDTIFDPGISV